MRRRIVEAVLVLVISGLCVYLWVTQPNPPPPRTVPETRWTMVCERLDGGRGFVINGTGALTCPGDTVSR